MYCIIFCSFCGYFAKISLLYQKFLEKYLVGSRKLPNFASSKEKNNLLKNIIMEKINNNSEKITGWDVVAIILTAGYVAAVACFYVALAIKTGQLSF